GRAALTAPELLALSGSRVVELVLAGGADRVGPAGLGTVVRLVGDRPGLAVLAAVPGPRPTPQAPAPSVFLYGVRLDDAFVARDTDAGGFGLSLLVGDDVVASNRSGAAREQIEQIAARARVADGVDDDGLTVSADGDSPSVSFRTLRSVTLEPAGTIALSRSAERSLAAQRDALRSLLLTAVVATAVVGGLALLFGRRTVEPVRRLTAAARLVTAGDLSVTTGLGGRDEVGTLSRSFDAMTGSVLRLTDDLRASALRLETVLSSMSDGLVAADAAGTVTSVNRAALAMAALDPEQALGRPVWEVLDLRAGGVPVDLAASTGADVPAEVHRADGTTVPVRVAVAPLDDGEGLVVVLRDTTREREVERMKTEFLSNVSHELRTPLTPIRGYAEILVSRPGLAADKVTSFATTIRDESIKMNRVVDLLVDVAAIEAGRVTVVARPVPPSDLVDARLEAWRTRDPARAGDLRRRVAARLPPVDVDPAWVGKALDELVDNALKYTPPGTAVTLTAALSPSGDRVRLAVRDAGPGIAEADQEGLFLSFEQVDGSATRRVGGLGLGLSFVRRLADDAGYPLSVTTSPGKGAEFALDLPLAAGVPEERRTRRPLRRTGTAG
ncbi:MAG: two-component system, OmpR family, phosphate regulon sensor histidine kinase PhoR, partial [Frankiales bacterium]|nr:two-component system, OmpR family, phosphate regulon sensor histidine kinase PhoR [Frankiales bacterium]